MRLRREAEFLDQLRQRHVGERLPAGTAEDQAGAIAQSLHVVQDRKRSPRERDAVIPLRLHARGGVWWRTRSRPRAHVDLHRVWHARHLSNLSRPYTKLNREVVSQIIGTGGGYVTVTPEYRVEVSPRLKLDYDNGHSYYPLHGSRVSLPTAPEDAPAPDYLRWHNEQVYRAS